MTAMIKGIFAGSLALVALAEPVAAQTYAPPWGTPLPSPPLAPSGGGTTMRVSTGMGDFVISLCTASAPVAAGRGARRQRGSVVGARSRGGREPPPR